MVPSVFADHLSDLEVEVKSQTDIGTVMIEKSEYIIAPREILYVKVFGEIDIDNPVNLPMDYTEFVSFETTNPNGTKFITEVSKTKKGYFENRIPVSYETRGDSPSPFGQYQVYVTFKGNSLGNLTFSVVDKATAEAAAQAAAETKAAAQAAAAQAAAEAKAAAQAAAEAKVAAEAKAEARAEAAQAAAEVRAETAQAATEAKVAAKAAAQTITTIIILAIVATIIVVIVMLARKTWKNQTDQINENYWRNNSKPTKEEPKEEEESMFCTNCGNRLTKAGAKFCRKCGSAQ